MLCRFQGFLWVHMMCGQSLPLALTHGLSSRWWSSRLQAVEGSDVLAKYPAAKPGA
jgi:hypothetical protein